MKVKVARSCLTLFDLMDYTVHGILQARILEWIAFLFSRGSSQTKDRTHVSCIAGRFFTIREALRCHWPNPYQEEVFPFQGAHLQYNLQGRIGQKSHPTANHAAILFIRVEAKCDQRLVAQTVKNLPAMQETWVQSLVGKLPCRRNWLPTPIFLPREFHGQRSLAGYSPWGHRVRHNWVT